MQRIVGEHDHADPEALNELVTVLSALLSFESFEALGPARRLEDVVPLVCRLAHAVLSL